MELARERTCDQRPVSIGYYEPLAEPENEQDFYVPLNTHAPLQTLSDQPNKRSCIRFIRLKAWPPARLNR